jgi:chromate transporter
MSDEARFQVSDSAVPGRSTPGLGAIFTGFLGVGLLGFGGVLPLARRMIVEQRKWLTAAEFVDLLALCQFLPGGNIINLSVAVGLRFRGVPGAVTALVALLAAPTTVAIALAVIYGRYQDDPVIRGLFTGLAAAAAGLVLAVAAKLARPLWGKLPAIGVATAVFVMIAVLRLPLLPTMLTMAPISVLVAWRLAR